MEFKARELERQFMREVSKKGYFKTALGKVNKVISYTKDYFIFRTGKSQKDLKITRKNLRAAMSFVYFKRTAVRKELELYSNFSSALFGVLFKIFEDIGKIQRLTTGLFRLTLKGVRYFPSGCCRARGDMEVIKETGGHFAFLNYYYIREQKNLDWLRHLHELDMYTYIDSGAFQFFEEKEKEQLSLFTKEEEDNLYFEAYMQFIDRFKDESRILGFFPLDVIGNPKKTRANFVKQKGITNKIIPVWQISDTLDHLEKLVKEDYPLIAIGGTVPLIKAGQRETVRMWFREIFYRFPDQNFHWLGGSNPDVHVYPFFSCDSSTWLNPRKNGERKLIQSDGSKIDAPTHMSMLDIMKQHLRYYIGLEDRYEKTIPLY